MGAFAAMIGLVAILGLALAYAAAPGPPGQPVLAAGVPAPGPGSAPLPAPTDPLEPANRPGIEVMAPPRIEPYVSAALDVLKGYGGRRFAYVSEKIDIIFYGDWDNPRSEGSLGVAAYIAEWPVAGSIRTIVGFPRYYDGALRDAAWTGAALLYESGRAHHVDDMDERLELAATAIRGIGTCTGDDGLQEFVFHGH